MQLLIASGNDAGAVVAGGLGLLMLLLFVLVGFVFYFVPTAIALMRRCKHTAGIVVLNIFLGWTLLGWVGALVWSVSDSRK